MGEVGLEPTRRNRHGLLRPACLPISALAQTHIAFFGSNISNVVELSAWHQYRMGWITIDAIGIPGMSGQIINF